MLKQRIITALILAPLFLLAVIYGQKYGFAALVLAITAAAIFEWLRINRLPTALTIINAFMLTVLTAYLMRFVVPFKDYVLLLSVMIIWLPALLWLRFYRWGYQQSGLQVMVKSLLGVAAIMLFALCMYQIHQQPQGILYILSLVFLVWIADIGAYIAGKNFGKHKLAINISPGKTWEGVIGAQIAVLIYAVVIGQFIDRPWYLLVPIMMLTALCSVVGDLTASLGKRQAEMKDSSQLLPGHGGVLDRFDSMIVAAPIYLLLLQLI